MRLARDPQLGAWARCVQLFVCLMFACAPAAGAQTPVTGAITGTVQSADGAGIPGAVITVVELRRATSSDQNGSFTLAGLPAGRYTVIVNIGELESRQADVDVVLGQAVRLARVLPRDFSVVMAVTVSGASRSPELLAEAPAPVTRVSAAQVALRGGSGQIPALLQFAPGVDYAQSGVYNMEFNSRGFNTALSRRVQVLIDGRDAAAPESKNQEWINLGFLTPDIEAIELVRGPNAALYGANSMNGVLMIETKTPRATPGGRARITTGDLGTFMADLRWAGEVAPDWWMKALANHTRSGSFARSRVSSTEYAGLANEVSPPLVDTEATSGALRVDRYTARGHQLILEGGLSRAEGGTYLSQAGRVGIERSTRGWGRVDYRTSSWRAAAHLNTRHADQVAFYAPFGFPTATVQFKAEAQTSFGFHENRGRVVAGMSFLSEHVDSADATGGQTLYARAVTTHAPGVFSQVDYYVSPRVKAVAALRWDESSLHGSQLSPRVAVVFAPSPQHSLRVGVNRGFQVGNYTELFLRVPAAPPADLSALEGALAPLLGGVSLGLGAVPIFAIGNTGLDVEKITSIEGGYAATFGSVGRLSVDVYRNRTRDFISDLLFGVNPAFPAYTAPAGLAPDVRAIVAATLNGIVPGLTNLPGGGAQVVLSNANVGEVRSRGVELGAALRPAPDWSLEASYTWFDFTLVDPQPGLEPKPNAPAHRAAFGVTYQRPRGAVSFHHRWVDGFRWASGVFDGPVPAYHVSDVNASYDLSDRWAVGLNVSNLFDRRHYEMFGGDLLRRRALVHATVVW